MGESGDREGNLIEIIEPLAFRAWPAAEVHSVGPWRCRHTPGIASRRINSVWTSETPAPPDMRQLIDECERYYAARNEPPRFQIALDGASAGLDEQLAKRGYVTDAKTEVHVAELADVHAVLRGARTAATIDVFDKPVTEWMDCFHRIGDRADDNRTALLETFERIEPAAGYALAKVVGEPVGVGVSVMERGWAGLFSFATATSHRRRGIGTAVLRAIIEWAGKTGAPSMYLQVLANNAGAIAFYRRFGFAPAYAYHYRWQPDACDSPAA